MKKTDFKAQLKQQKGIAILMVMTAVALLSFLLADFTFETRINKFKVYNLQDKLQARLNAEAGLRFAMAKLKIYQEGRNMIEKNENLKGQVNISLVESALIQPFIFPISLGKDANLVQKKALEEFTSENVLQGQLQVFMTPVSGFLNPNNLRIAKKTGEEEDTRYNQSQEDKEDSPQVLIEKKFIETLKDAIDDKRENDDIFDALYGNLNPELLIKELKFYVSDQESYDEPERAEIEARYLADDIIPKYAPLTSIDELYMLQGWDDAIVDLIKDRMSVHEVSIIQVNEITQDQLKILFPTITPIQIEEFFKHRDGDDELKIKPQPFRSVDDFKSVVINDLGIVDEATYDERLKEFEKAGLTLGVAGKLYKVTSTGIYGRSTYTITAFVDLPVLPSPEPQKEDDKNKNNNNQNPDNPDNPDDQDPDNDPDNPDSKKKVKTLQLMDPRVVEVRIQ